jgi:hypothetical protein
VGLLLLLGSISLISGFISGSMGLTSQYRLISSYGTIRSMENIVTWTDETSETIKVDDQGRIFLNGSQTIAFGFHIITAKLVGEPQDSNQRNAILDQLQVWGVRFMALGCMSWMTLDQLQWWLNFWLPKLYAHKMFVMLEYQESPNDNIDVTTQYNRLSAVIDMVTDQRYADIIFSVCYSWEQDIYTFGHTNEEVETYLSSLYPMVKSKLQSSLIGDVPLVAKHSATDSETGTRQIIKWSDVPCWDLYSDEDWEAYIAPRLVSYHNTTLPQSEKEGYQIWFQESGNVDGLEYYTPEMFQYLLDGGGYKDVSLIFLWCLEWDYADYPNAWFDMEGNPKPQLLELVPYIP